MTSKRGRREQSGKRPRTKRQKTKKAVLCSMDCGKRARTVCAACQRPLCKDHTILIPFGPRGDDVLNLEVCGACAETEAIIRRAFPAKAKAAKS